MQFSKKDLDVIYKYITSKMFGDKLSDYPPVEELTGTELMPIIQNGENKNVQSSNLVTLPQLVAKFAEYSEGIEALNHKLNEKVVWLTNLIENLEVTGMIVMQEFGDSESFGISQKKITAAINQLWEKIEDMTGEIIRGINMVVTPTYFVSENGCDIHISANTVETNGIFEKIQFFVDNVLIYEDTDTEYVSFDHHIDVKPAPDYTYVVMCKAKIMGVEYTRQQVITRYNEFFIGAGSAYTDILDSAHSRQLNGTMRHNYDVTFGEGDKLIIVMGAALREGFIRADLNGVEIQMEEQTVTIDGKQYVVLTSDSWSAGDYNIDING
jgi:hypothetical protein